MSVETVSQNPTQTETPDSSVSRNGKRIDPAESPTAQMAERRKKGRAGKGLPKIGTAWWITIDEKDIPVTVDDSSETGVTVTCLTDGEVITMPTLEDWKAALPWKRDEPDEQFMPKPVESAPSATPSDTSGVHIKGTILGVQIDAKGEGSNFNAAGDAAMAQATQQVDQQTSAPKPNPGQQAADTIIEQFHKEYLPALAEAYLSEQTTATPGWLSMFEQHRKMLRENRVALVRRMRSCADLLEEVGWNEDDEKAVKNIAKSHEELRATQAALEREVIDRVIAPVKACERIIDKYRGDAERRAVNSPMFAGNLLQKVERAIADQPKPSWELNTGRVRVLKP